MVSMTATCRTPRLTRRASESPKATREQGVRSSQENWQRARRAPLHRISLWHMKDERELTVELEEERGETELPHLRLAPDDLQPDTLRAVVESFVLREGTDYGVHETSLEDKVAQVLRQLRRGEAHITFDPATKSVNIVETRAIAGQGGAFRR